MSTIASLLDKAKDAIAAGDTGYRKAAELIAQAQESGATQRQVADGVGRSQSWISRLLQWRKDDYSGGAFDRSHKTRMRPAHNPKSRTSPASKPKAKPASTGERARADHARAQADAERARAQTAKAEAARAKAEASSDAIGVDRGSHQARFGHVDGGN